MFFRASTVNPSFKEAFHNFHVFKCVDVYGYFLTVDNQNFLIQLCFIESPFFLEVACFRAEKNARTGLVQGLTKERFLGRSGLVTDELLEMTIANYNAGARGIFEFIRFDKEKPGISRKL